jgi:hypothetical protein
MALETLGGGYDMITGMNLTKSAVAVHDDVVRLCE